MRTLVTLRKTRNGPAAAYYGHAVLVSNHYMCMVHACVTCVQTWRQLLEYHVCQSCSRIIFATNWIKECYQSIASRARPRPMQYVAVIVYLVQNQSINNKFLLLLM